MKKISFIFCIHNHQPVGNFDFVIENGLRSAYQPFLHVLAEHPRIKMVLHVSGALLEWIERHHEEYFDEVRELVARGQLELMTGGFYEPVLPSIPDEDKVGQIRKLTSFVRDKLDFEPKGMWLPERVWEPSLASAIARAGVEYTVVDDSHFKSSGLTEKELLGYYLTEDQGAAIKVFSGSKRLRYLIPFVDPGETIDCFRENTSGKEGNLLVFADDGEKFGIWPGTGKLCYQEKWLDRFFTILEDNSEWVNVTTFSEYISRHRPLGWVFLPTASYAEMMEWCLPVEAQLRYQEFLGNLKASGELLKYESFVKGGFWRNFFSRYPESNWMHKRMLSARRLVSSALSSEASKQRLQAALNEIWKAQCNCAYWHGVFGGLYLPHLREAVYKHIIRAEKIALEATKGPEHPPSVERTDIDGDGENEIVLSSEGVAWYVSPVRGGTLVEIDHRGREINLVNTLARRREAYHSQLKSGNPHQSGDGAVSIHNAITAKEEKLEEFLFYDRFPRVCLLDHFLPPQTSLQEMYRSEFEELGGFVEAPYSEKEPVDDKEVLLGCSGAVQERSGPVGLTIEKGFSLRSDEASLLVSYELTFDGAIASELLFAPELNFLFPSGRGLKGTIGGRSAGTQTFELAKAAEFSGVTELGVRDDHLGLATVISAERMWKLWHFPVETISLSEGGLERVYQCTCIIPVWLLPSGSTEARFRILIRLEDGDQTQTVAGNKEEPER